jgi:predicted TIM-barrel fold metal-dependent hydrolase
MPRICDAHCHFFSSRFLELLTKDVRDLPDADRAGAIAARLGWEPPGSPEQLADRWIAELDRHDVARASLIASIPGDEASVAAAVARSPSRFVGMFMFNPSAPGAIENLPRMLGEQRLRVIALFPAMHKYRVDDPRIAGLFEVASDHGAAVFVHCGVLTVGVRKKLGLPCPFDLRLGDPLAVAVVALQHPRVPFIIPHFGAGLFRETLMAADQCPNVYLDTSSSNSWMRYEGLDLKTVFRRALDVAGPSRLLFGSDSSFFPRGWNGEVFLAQARALAEVGISNHDAAAIFGGNLDRLLSRG